MQATDVLRDGFERIRGLVGATAGGLDADALVSRPGPEANSIGWLLWHLTRVQDDHVAEVLGTGQVWTDREWAEAFGLPAGSTDTGFGHTSEQVASIRPQGPETLTEYHEAVAARTLAWLETLGPDDLDRVVDRSYDPPVTLGVRLVSVLEDVAQHVGQAAFLRGLVTRS